MNNKITPNTIRYTPKTAKEYEYRHEPVDLLRALYGIFSRGGKKPDGAESAAALLPRRIVYSVRDKSRQILLRLREGGASLDEFYAHCRSRSEIVATFVSVLELCSMGSVHIRRREEKYFVEFAGGDMDEILEKIAE